MIGNGYADDLQLLRPVDLAADPHATSALSDISRHLTKHVLPWLTRNQMFLNISKCELIIFGNSLPPTVSALSIDINGTTINSVPSIKLLGVHLDSSLTLSNHISSVCSSSYYSIKCLSSCSKYLTSSDLSMLAAGLIISKIDYCNSLLVDCPANITAPLTKVLNAAARCVLKKGKRDHIAPMLIALHWLPIHFRSLFKLNLLVFKALRTGEPAYLFDALRIQPVVRATRSSNTLRLLPTQHQSALSKSAFSTAAAVHWNSLPSNIRTSESIANFKKLLKCHYFSAAFD
jgi:hypothetical protein